MQNIVAHHVSKTDGSVPREHGVRAGGGWLFKAAGSVALPPLGCRTAAGGKEGTCYEDCRRTIQRKSSTRKISVGPWPAQCSRVEKQGVWRCLAWPSTRSRQAPALQLTALGQSRRRPRLSLLWSWLSLQSLPHPQSPGALG